MKNGHPAIVVDGVFERPYEWVELAKRKNPHFQGYSTIPRKWHLTIDRYSRTENLFNEYR